jgi:cell division protein FtsI/penicillin-binding protein 2
VGKNAGMASGTRTRPLAAVVAAVTATLATAATAGCSNEPSPDGPLRTFLTAWSKGELSGLTLLDETGRDLSGSQAQRQLVTVTGDLAATPPQVKPVGKPKVTDDDATAKVSVSWKLAGAVAWDYQTTVRMRRSGDTWRVIFGASTVHPDLTSTDALTVRRVTGERAAILDGGGQPIVSQRPVVVVGVQPSEVKDIPATVAQLTSIISKVEPGLTFSDLPEKIKAAKPDAFVEVITLRREKYDVVRPELRALESTHFQESTLPLAPTSAFARALLGSTGEVTKEIMDKSPGRYQIGDKVGMSGLQQRYDSVLRGTPGLTVTISGASGGDGRQLFSSQPAAGKAIRTSIDQKAQHAADTALTGVNRNTALVAIRISDGAMVAVANGTGGPNKGDVNLALTAQVPPGSTFKAVTALGLLDLGAVTADTVVPCPKTLAVGGTSYKNAHDDALGDVPFRVDFAKSCNTAFASLAGKLGPDGLANTAATLGVGTEWDLGLEVFTGKVSSGGSEAERAAAAFGQGTTVVSPAAMAAAAAAIAGGQFRQPKLVLEPAPGKPSPDGPRLRPESLTALRTMMREVVTKGTATGLAGSGEVYGKTGTAEFVSGDPSKTHSWFMGYRGDLAFAILVEDGGTSTDVAVPLAATFLKNLG